MGLLEGSAGSLAKGNFQNACPYNLIHWQAWDTQLIDA